MRSVIGAGFQYITYKERVSAYFVNVGTLPGQPPCQVPQKAQGQKGDRSRERRRIREKGHENALKDTSPGCLSKKIQTGDSTLQGKLCGFSVLQEHRKRCFKKCRFCPLYGRAVLREKALAEQRRVSAYLKPAGRRQAGARI